MSKSKLFLILFLSAAIITGLIMLLVPRNVDIEPVTQEEAAWAKSFLLSSLNNRTVFYEDFIEEKADIGSFGGKAGFSASFKMQDAGVDADTGGAAQLEGGDSAVFHADVPAQGFYELTLECSARDRSFVNITLAVEINGQLQYSEAANIDIPLYWADTTKDWPLDSFGDETIPAIEHLNNIRSVGLHNNTYITATPVLFWLDEGKSEITLTNKSARVLLVEKLHVNSAGYIPPYEEYFAGQAMKEVSLSSAIPANRGITEINATMYEEKNTTFIQLNSTNTIGAIPFDPVNRLINITGFNILGAEALYKVYVENPGFYTIALNTVVSNDDFPSFCTLRVDGRIPFFEAMNYPLTPSGNTNRWSNVIFADDEDNPFFIWLDAGEHTISLRNDCEPISKELRNLRLLIDHINQFSLDIKKVAGRDIDRNRTWRMTRYMPEIEDTLKAYDIMLRDLATQLGRHSPRDVNSAILSGLVESLALLEIMREYPDEIPLYLETLSGDRVSILMQAGNTLDNLMSLSFDINMIYLYDGTSSLPRANPPFTVRLSALGSQLWASFVSPKYAVRSEDDSLNIWVNASAMLVDAMQKLADSRFTPETGIKVNFSIMPDANKLVLASAGDTQPDMAMSIERHIPFDLAVRDALYDLSQFDDFWEIAARFPPGSLIPFILNDGLYGIPESTDFFTLVYREDILNSLNLPVPDTWNDVTEMMSELQRFDMSFYMPIASGVGYKWFHQTAPLIYQTGGSFYQSDGLGTAIGEPEAVRGITFLGDLFTTYAMNEQVPSFFNAFRYGQTPIGIGGVGDYLLIKYGAPELVGQWKLSLPPGIEQEDGSVSRWYVANGRCAVIFAGSDMVNEGWEFIKWWTSEDAQTEYAFNLLSAYGYIYLPSNLSALENSYLPDEDKEVILESIKWLRDVPRSPGQYMLERSLSDIWNTIVFDGTPAQVAIDIRAIDIGREFRRKMTEFGYIDAEGNALRPYAVRELDWVLEQLRIHN